MSIGVAVANAVLLITFARERRRAGDEPATAAIAAARGRLRPISDDVGRDDRRNDSDGAWPRRGRRAVGAASGVPSSGA